MKKFLLVIIAVMMMVPAYADLQGDGYYRVQNAMTKRYAYLLDNKGSMDMATSSADVAALQLWSDFDKASSDPSTIFKITNCPNTGSNLNHDIAAQGTSLHTFLDTYLKILSGGKYEGKSSYYAYAQKSGFIKYLGDIRDDLTNPKGVPSADAKGDDRKWYIHAVDGDSDDNYFGIAPTVANGNKYYKPFYADFPIKAKSEGVKIYIVDRLVEGAAVLKECTGYVPARTAVIIECAHTNSSDNRLDITSDGAAANVSGNMLKGVFFDNDMPTHYNRTPYNKSTMRSLACVDGKLTFVTGSYDFVTRNEAYLQVAGGTASILRLLKEDEVPAYLDELAFERNKISAISFDPVSVKVERGTTVALNPVTTPENPSNPGFNWSTSDASIATVADGVVTGHKTGTCNITATSSNGVSGSAQVTVIKSPEGVTLNVSELSLASQERFQLNATLYPEDVTETNLTWSSSDQEVAVVDATGLVRARFAGIATITVTTTNGLTATCKVYSGNTGIAEVSICGDAEIYDIDGNRVDTMLPGNVYVVIKDGKSQKVLIK